MWCAYAPAFDGNERLITVFGEYLRRSLPGDEWVRWLPAPPLLDLATLVAERLRAGQPRAALRLAAVMADTAQILLLDTRFRPRALALLTMVEPMLRKAEIDEPHEDDAALRQAWLKRCPPRLCRALLVENDPEGHFSHSVYDLVDALSFMPDPREAAATFLADLSDSRGVLPGRLDHRLRMAYEELRRAGLTSTSAAERTEPEGFPVRGGGVSVAPAPVIEVAPPDRASAAAVLGAAYATGLAWERLTGAKMPERGLASQTALVRKIVHERDDHHTGHM